MKLISNKQVIVVELAHQAFTALKVLLTKQRPQASLEAFFLETLQRLDQHADVVEAVKLHHVQHYQYRVLMTGSIRIYLTNALEDQGIELAVHLSQDAKATDVAFTSVLRKLFEPDTEEKTACQP